MKDQLLAALGKSTDITVVRGTFLDGKNFFRAILFGTLEAEDENCFCVRESADSPNSVSFTADMVRSAEFGANHNIVVIYA